MVLSEEDKAVIKNDFIEKNWTAYRIVREHPSKNWQESTVKRLLKKFRETGSTARRPGSGRPATAVTPENEETVEELVLSQEDKPGTHMPPRKIAKHLNISRESVRRICKKRNLNNFKREHCQKVKDDSRKRRQIRSEALAQRFSANRKIERLVFQDESLITLQVRTNRQNNRVYHKGTKKDVPDVNLFHESNTFSKKLMISAGFTWFGVTRPFFVNEEGVKVNGENYQQHLQEELLPAIRSVYPREDFTFIQDGASSHTDKRVQKFLRANLGRRFVVAQDWPPHSPDCNPLDYYFWNEVKEKVFEGRHNTPFSDLTELRSRIEEVWDECATNLIPIRKAMRQFVPRLRAVADHHGCSIKKQFK